MARNWPYSFQYWHGIEFQPSSPGFDPMPLQVQRWHILPMLALNQSCISFLWALTIICGGNFLPSFKSCEIKNFVDHHKRGMKLLLYLTPVKTSLEIRIIIKDWKVFTPFCGLCSAQICFCVFKYFFEKIRRTFELKVEIMHFRFWKLFNCCKNFEFSHNGFCAVVF